jgi:hypothetical protein
MNPSAFARGLLAVIGWIFVGFAFVFAMLVLFDAASQLYPY